ncbi:MAG: hypothetical protein RLZZ111_2075 [Planctomycetota bacterium]|jgi:hypothetical protein
MFRSRLAQATLIGCLAALASFCALEAWATETYSIVAQSTQASAGTGRRPLAERIAAANLPIITQTAAAAPRVTVAASQAAAPRAATAPRAAGPRAVEEPTGENMAVAAVRVDRPEADAPLPPSPEPRKTPPVRWPFASRQPTAIAKETEDQARQAAQRQAAQRQAAGQRQARSSGKGLSNSSPAAVTR